MDHELRSVFVASEGFMHSRFARFSRPLAFTPPNAAKRFATRTA